MRKEARPECEDFSWLLDADEIGFDIETKDPYLMSKGPGVFRKDGYVCGFSCATKDRGVYLDIQHPDTTPERKERNLKIVRDILARPHRKVGANIAYDLDWTINNLGIPVKGKYEDIQFAEPLIDEYRKSFSLSNLAGIYACPEKATGVLERYCDEQGWKYKDAREHIWKMPAQVVGQYAELDGMLPLQILAKQKEILEQQGLMDIYEVEIGLLPLLTHMRKLGVRIDLPLFKQTALSVADELYSLEQKIYAWAGKEFNISSTLQLAKLFDAHGIAYPRKEPTMYAASKGFPGNPNLDKDVLTRMYKDDNLEIANTILNWRHYNTLTNMFLVPYLDFLVGERLHCSFHPLRSDERGAVSGRFSSSRPNLQQVPAQSNEDFASGESEETDLLAGQIIRKLFIPEPGYAWAKLDYSQVEYRIAAHYAIGPGAEDLRKAYNDNPNTDYHQHIMDLTGFNRRTAKRLNFGASYGMGYKAAARKFYWTENEAQEFMQAYHAAAPYLKETRRRVVEKAERAGFVFTVLGRRARVHPSRKVHSLYNRLIQGSAADIMKKGLVDAWNKGLFDVLHPHITVHDEIDVSVPPTKEGTEALAELKRTMETCVPLRVPLVVDCHTAANWAEAD